MPEPWFFDVLACHPPPYPGECLSGYLIRLAEANHCIDLWSFISDLFPLFRSAKQISLLCTEYPIDDWGRIPLRTQLPLATLKSLTVRHLTQFSLYYQYSRTDDWRRLQGR